MHAKLLAPLAGGRIQAAHKFPQLHLQAAQRWLVTRHRQCNLPLQLFQPSSVDFAGRELEAGRIVEVRGDDNSLVALGFYEPQLQRVDVFDMTPSLSTTLPTISEDSFMARVHDAWERRRRILPQTHSNTYRIVNGSADSLPSLFVDVFSECFVRVVATSFGAERLVPPLLDFLSRRGAEDVLLDTPTLGDAVRASLITPTLPLPQIYVEGGVSHMWLKRDMRLPSTENLFLVNTAHRRTRRMMRDVGKGKRVLTIYDRSGSASMNAIMTAKHVTVAHREETYLEWARANLICNHSASVFKTCETVCCDPAELHLRHQQDVVYMECHPKFLSTHSQWVALVQALATNKVIGIGTILVLAQEEAPLGVRDLLPRRAVFYGGDESKANEDRPMTRRPLADVIRDALERCNLRLKFLRAFSVACDYPLLPEEESPSFSQIYLVEGPVLNHVFRAPPPCKQDWRTEASRVIRAFDEALGRPPFPVEASDDLVLKAHAVHATIETVVSTGKLKVLDGVSEVTTTLPVLCASLAEGSPNRTPCLKLYRPLLLAVGEVICFSTYPISYLLRDAERLLAPRVDSVSIRPSVNSAAASNSTAACSAVAHDAAEVDNEVTLFRFMVLTRTLTPAYMRSFLRLPALDTVSGGKKANKKAGKGNQKSQKGASFGDDHGNKAPVSSHRPGSFAEEAHGVGSRNSTVPRALLRAMIDAPLPEECRAVFELFVDNTSKFLHCVAGDGDLAERILNVYATRIVPKLKPSSLLPCLDAPLLDYYVDIVAASQHARYATLLTSPELRNVALQTWDLARLRRLGRAAVSRKIEAHDAMASLVVYVFLYLIYCSLAQDHISPATTLPSSPNAPETEACISVTETYLITAVYKASKAVLFGDGVRSACEAGAFAYAQSRAGVLLVEGGAAPPALEPLQVFGALLLTRPVAAALWQGGFGLQWDDTEDVRATAGEIATSASLLEALVVSILANISRGPPNEGQAVYSSSKQQQKSTQGGPARSKGKQRRSAGGGENSSRTDVVSCSPIGRPPEDAARNPPLPPTPLSELLSNCCICMLLIILARRGTGASGDEGCTSAHAGYPQGAYLLDCIIRAYAYLLQHQSPHLNAALWDNFSVLLTCCMWQWALAVSCGDTAALEEAYLPSMEKLLSSPRTTTVLTALTADTGSILWLSPLLLPASLSQQDSSNPARRVLSQALWGSLCRPLWMAVVHAAVSADSPGGEATAPEQTPKAVSTPLKRQLHPVCDGFLLGVLCSQWSHAVLADVAECLAAATTRRGDGASLVARLFHMCADDACSRTVAKPPVCGVTLEYVPASLFSHGLHCFLSEVKRCQEKNSCTAELAKQRECEESRQRIQEKVEGIRALAEADRIFHEAEEARRAARTDAQRHVREELERRRAAHTARLRDEAAALERKRLVALQTLQRKAEETRLEAEAARRRRFMSYKRRLESEYRVSTFLEHLQLSSARVMEVREQLRTVMDRITPDDLLEYLVSGVAKVPADMLDDADAERVDIAHRTADGDTVVGDKQAPVGELNPKRKAPEPVAHLDRPFEECHGFWADVMDGASINARTAHQDGAGSSSRPLGEVGAAQPMGKVDAPSPATDRICSFHARIAPLMDLFCYDDGDEFGRVPDRLPYLRLRTASRVWPAAKIQSLGFTDVHEAFGRMGERGLVRLYDGVVQLTLLGFRYHYPFHNPEGMLEVLLREAQEHARALAGARRSSLTHKDAGDEGSESDNDSVVDCSESLSLSEDRLLPEVEFGI